MAACRVDAPIVTETALVKNEDGQAVDVEVFVQHRVVLRDQVGITGAEAGERALAAVRQEYVDNVRPFGGQFKGDDGRPVPDGQYMP